MSISTTRGYGSGTKTTTGKSSGSSLDSLTVSGEVDVGGNATIAGNLTVAGSIVSGSYNPTNLTVTGTSTLSSIVNSGSAALGSTSATSLSVTGATNVSSLTATGTATLPTIAGPTTLTGTTTASTISATTLGVSGAATLPNVTGPTTLTGDLTVSGTLTASSITGGTSGDFTVSNGNLYLQEATSAIRAANATLITYNAQSAANYIQLASTATGTTASNSMLVGLQSTNTLIQNASGGNINLDLDDNVGAVTTRGGPFYVRKDAHTDGTFNTNSAIGVYDASSNFTALQLQNSTTGTGSNEGVRYAANGINAEIIAPTGGSIILNTDSLSAEYDAAGNLTIPGNFSSIAGNVTCTLVGAVCPAVFAWASGTAFGSGNELGAPLSAGSTPLSLAPTTYGSLGSIKLIGYVWTTTADITALTLGLYVNGTYASGADIEISSFTSAPGTRHGTLDRTISTSNALWAYRWRAGSLSSATGFNLVVYYRIVSF